MWMFLLLIIGTDNWVKGVEKPIETTSYDVTYKQQQVNGQDFRYVQDNYYYQGQGYTFTRKIEYKADSGFYISRFYLPGDKGTVTYFNEGKYLEEPLQTGDLPMDGKLMLQTETYGYVLGQAYSYTPLGNGTVESLEERYPIRVSRKNGKWVITYRFPHIKDSFGMMWGIGLSGDNLELETKLNRPSWTSYDVDIKARILNDGYYYKSPSTYEPSTQMAYWRIPSMYLVTAMIEERESLASDLLGQSLLFTGVNNLNEEGFLPSLPKSEWLEEEYSIKSGFFDTRFNADMIETYFKAYKAFERGSYRKTYLTLADYYIKHIQNEHILVEKEDKEGWLVEDYSHSDQEVVVHSSLNHQLQAIHMLLLLYEEEGMEDYQTTANKMLEGIRLTKDKWVMDDGNLEYAYLPDGTMGYVDYPYLTYNDMYDVQSDLLRIYGEEDRVLRYLMNTKLKWMKENNITEYKQ